MISQIELDISLIPLVISLTQVELVISQIKIVTPVRELDISLIQFVIHEFIYIYIYEISLFRE